MFLGRAIHYPIAMDGALKLKEISYIHAEGYPTGEAKHGPNALIDYRLPLVMIATCDPDDAGSVLRYQKNVSNMEGFKKQGGTVIAIATQGDAKIPQLANHTVLYSRKRRSCCRRFWRLCRFNYSLTTWQPRGGWTWISPGTSSRP